MINYRFLLRIKYPKNLLSFVIGGILIITFFLTIYLKTYSSYHTFGIYKDYLIISVPVENSDAVNNGEYVKIDNHKYKYQIASISEIKIVNQRSYQEYYLKLNKNFIINELVEITFYYNKEEIIKKITSIIF